MNFVTYFVIFGFLCTIAILLVGGLSMVHGGKFDATHAEGLMEGSVITQAITFGLIAMSVLVWA